MIDVNDDVLDAKMAVIFFQKGFLAGAKRITPRVSWEDVKAECRTAFEDLFIVEKKEVEDGHNK